jgi:hypothetical protein
MGRIRIVGLALVAVFALSAVAASAAFAGSEFLAKGGANPAGITFKGTGGKAFFESEGGNKVVCEKSESTGKFESALEARVTVTYSGECKLEGTLKNKCPTIKTKELKVIPGSKVGANETRLEVFLPVSGETLAEFSCEGTEIKVTGGVICKNNKPALGLKGEVECKELPEAEKKLGLQEFKEALSWEGAEEKDIKDELKATATLGFIKITEDDAQNTTEALTFSAEVEQTVGS